MRKSTWLAILLLAATITAMLYARCTAGDKQACRHLASLPLVDHTVLPQPGFSGRFGGAVHSLRARNASATMVLYTEEGSYFGARPWPRSLAHGMVAGEETITCEGEGAIRVLKNLRPKEAAAAMRGPGAAAAHVRVVHSPDWQSTSAVAALRSTGRDVLVHYSMETPLMWPADLDAE